MIQHDRCSRAVEASLLRPSIRILSPSLAHFSADRNTTTTTTTNDNHNNSNNDSNNMKHRVPSHPGGATAPPLGTRMGNSIKGYSSSLQSGTAYLLASWAHHMAGQTCASARSEGQGPKVRVPDFPSARTCIVITISTVTTITTITTIATITTILAQGAQGARARSRARAHLHVGLRPCSSPGPWPRARRVRPEPRPGGPGQDSPRIMIWTSILILMILIIILLLLL